MVVYLVGAGPGDIELLTLKALRLVREADVLVYDNLANKKILDFTKPSCKKIYVGKIRGKHHKTQDEINEILIDAGKKFSTVVRLKGGDPYIFGRGGEEAELLHGEGIRFEVVPGISSANAVPMYAGIPLSHRDYNYSFAVLTGHRAEGKEQINWEKLPDVLVILMGVANVENNVKNLIAAGYPEDTPVAGIYKGTTSKQRVIKTTLKELPSKKLERPMIFVVGKIVELSDKLDWFGDKMSMLKDKTVLATRELSEDNKKTLTNLGANIIEMPLIEIKDREFELPDLDKFDVIVFTSVNGIKVVLNSVDLGKYKDKTFYAIGPKTRDALANFGINASIPEKYNSESLGKFMIKNIPEGKKILLLRSDRASPLLKDMLSSNYDVKEIPVYGIDVKEPDLDRLENSDIVFITSSSIGETYSKYHDNKRIVVSIGPMTSETLRKNNVRVNVEASNSTVEGMIESTIEYLWRNEK